MADTHRDVGEKKAKLKHDYIWGIHIPRLTVAKKWESFEFQDMISPQPHHHHRCCAPRQQCKKLQTIIGKREWERRREAGYNDKYPYVKRKKEVVSRGLCIRLFPVEKSSLPLTHIHTQYQYRTTTGATDKSQQQQSGKILSENFFPQLKMKLNHTSSVRWLAVARGARVRMYWCVGIRRIMQGVDLSALYGKIQGIRFAL